MDATDFRLGKEHRPSGGVHPLAAAVALALAGALSGCATQSLPPDASEVDRAKAAFARKDYAEAARLLSDPAMKGDPGAQYALGYLYYYGQGVPQDFYRARSWLETSAQLGNRDAKRALATLKVYGKLPQLPATTAAAQPVPPAVAAPTDAKGTSVAAMPPVAPATMEPASGANLDLPAAAEAAPVDAPVESGRPPVASAPAVVNVPAAPVAAAPTADAKPIVTPPLQAAPVKAPEEAAPVASVPVTPVRNPVPSSPAEMAPPAVLPNKAEPDASATASGEVTAVEGEQGAMQARGDAAPAAPTVDAAVPAAQPAPAVEESIDESVVAAGDSGEGAPAGVDPVARPMALQRPAVAPVSLVPGSEQAQPVIRKPAPRSERARYTIHLLSSPKKEDLLRTVRAFGLAQAAWYPVSQAGGTQYRLIFGAYETVAEAREAMRALPEALYASNPWVNNYPVSVTVATFNGIPTARVAAVERGILR